MQREIGNTKWINDHKYFFFCFQWIKITITKSENISICLFIRILIHKMPWIILIHVRMIRVTYDLFWRIVPIHKHPMAISLFFLPAFRILYCLISIIIAVRVLSCLPFSTLTLLLKFRLADSFISLSILASYLVSIRSLLFLHLFKSVILHSILKLNFNYDEIVYIDYLRCQIDLLLFYWFL